MNGSKMSNVILIGNSGVGKSSIIERYIHNHFQENSIQSTVGKNSDIVTEKDENGQDIQFKLWDTAGQEKFKSISSSFYRKVQACIFVASIDDRNSLRELVQWKKDFEDINVNSYEILAINKTDLMPNVPMAVNNDYNNDNDDQMLSEFIRELKNILKGFPNYIFVSAKDGSEIKELFQLIAQYISKNPIDSNDPVVNLPEDQQNSDKKCC